MEETKTNQLFDKLAELKISIHSFELEPEGKEYEASRFKIGDFNILARKAKITPTKKGQFVTCWKRNNVRITEPFSENSTIDFLFVLVNSATKSGFFAFPKSVLIELGIFTSELKAGKRAFRVYPPWDKVESKQATNSKKWQLESFYTFNSNSEIERFKSLFNI